MREPTGGSERIRRIARMNWWYARTLSLFLLVVVLDLLVFPCPTLAQGVFGPPQGFVDGIAVPSTTQKGTISRFDFRKFIDLIERHGQKVSQTERAKLCGFLPQPCNGRFRIFTSNHFAEVFFAFEGDLFSLRKLYLLSANEVIASFPLEPGRKITFVYSFREDGLDPCVDTANYLAELWLLQGQMLSSGILYSVRATPSCPTQKSRSLLERKLGSPYKFMSRDGFVGYMEGF
jgi:hypothetical protein